MKIPDAIVVLSAGIKQNPSGRWMSTDLTEADDKLGAPGGILRVLAAAVLSNQYPGAVVIPSGGKGFDVPEGAPEDRPLLCEIMRNELLEANVPKERILLEGKSNTTYQQLRKLARLIQEHGWRKVVVVSNRWHLPRLRAIVEAKFFNLGHRLELVAAEDILIAKDPLRWELQLAGAYRSAFLLQRIERENRGIREIKDGTYNFK